MMNDMERKIDDYVNRAQLAINDWQCSGEKILSAAGGDALE